MDNQKSCFIGIDLAFAKKKHLPIVICIKQSGRLIPLPLRHLNVTPPSGKGNIASINEAIVCKFAEETFDYINLVCNKLNLTPIRIGIDAPSSPRKSIINRRLSEEALDKAGISCFPTPSNEEFKIIREKVKKHLASGGSASTLPHANQLWMLVGFVLFEKLSNLAPCLEVFPQAIVKAIGTGQIHKSQPGAVDQQFIAASQYTGWKPESKDNYTLKDIAWGDRHDQLDAYLSAWVASLEESERVAYGVPPYDAIWVPNIENKSFEILSTPESVAASIYEENLKNKKSCTKLIANRICPGCRKFEFKKWPFGWDAHAAHKCTGLAASTPEQRKAEFRRKYLNS